MKTLVRKPRDSRTNAASEWRSLTALTDKRPIPQSNKARASFSPPHTTSSIFWLSIELSGT